MDKKKAQALLSLFRNARCEDPPTNGWKIRSLKSFAPQNFNASHWLHNKFSATAGFIASISQNISLMDQSCIGTCSLVPVNWCIALHAPTV
jgi:hypothetical protein